VMCIGRKKKGISTENVVPHEGQVAAVVKSENVVERKVPHTGGVKAPPPGLTKQPSHTNAVNGKCCNWCVLACRCHCVCALGVYFLCISDSGVIFMACVFFYFIFSFITVTRN